MSGDVTWAICKNVERAIKPSKKLMGREERKAGGGEFERQG